MEKFVKMYDTEPDLTEEEWFKVSAVLKFMTAGTKRPKRIITFGSDTEGKYIRWYDDGETMTRIDAEMKIEGEHEIDDDFPMVFKVSHAWFSFDKTKLHLSFQAGPLFGRGRVYDYSFDENGNIKLSNEETIWVS